MSTDRTTIRDVFGSIGRSIENMQLGSRLSGIGRSATDAFSTASDGMGGRISTLQKTLGGYTRDYLGAGEAYKIHGREYVLGRQLAEGSFAYVFLAKESATQSEVVIKRVIVHDARHMALVKSEVELLRQLQHRHIVRFIDAALNRRDDGSQEVLLVTEYCPHGTLYDLLVARERTRLTEHEIVAAFVQVCQAVAFLHAQSPPIQHRDLKIENVLVASDRSLKLCDFGSATTRVYLPRSSEERQMAELDISKNVTKNIRAPEMVDLYLQYAIDEKADVWALGCLLYRLMFLKDAFEGTLPILEAKYELPDLHPYSPGLIALLRRIFTPNPADRPTVFDVLEALDVPVSRPDPSRVLPKPVSLAPSSSSSSFSTAHSSSPATSSQALSLFEWSSAPAPASPPPQKAPAVATADAFDFFQSPAAAAPPTTAPSVDLFAAPPSGNDLFASPHAPAPSKAADIDPFDFGDFAAAKPSTTPTPTLDLTPDFLRASPANFAQPPAPSWNPQPTMPYSMPSNVMSPTPAPYASSMMYPNHAPYSNPPYASMNANPLMMNPPYSSYSGSAPYASSSNAYYPPPQSSNSPSFPPSFV